MNIKRIIFLFTFISPLSYSADFEFSLGAGLQYSGAIGSQFALKTEESKYFVSVGLPGYSLGMQTTISDNQNHSVGFSYGRVDTIFSSKESRYGFITYNYHFSSFQDTGWLVGTGIGFYDEASHKILFTNERKDPSAKAMYTLDIGYKF